MIRMAFEQRRLAFTGKDFAPNKANLIEDDHRRWEFKKYQWLLDRYKDKLGKDTVDRIYFDGADCNFRTANRMLRLIETACQLELYGKAEK